MAKPVMSRAERRERMVGILSDLRAGAAAAAVAAKHGVTLHYVWMLRRQGLPPEPAKRVHAAGRARKAEMARLYREEGLTLAAIAERNGITTQRVSQILGGNAGRRSCVLQQDLAAELGLSVNMIGRAVARLFPDRPARRHGCSPAEAAEIRRWLALPPAERRKRYPAREKPVLARAREAVSVLQPSGEWIGLHAACRASGLTRMQVLYLERNGVWHTRESPRKRTNAGRPAREYAANYARPLGVAFGKLR